MLCGMGRRAATTATQSRSELARARLLETGLACFARHGLDCVSIRELAQQARLNSATISDDFGGKEGLYDAVLAQVVTFVRGHAAPVSADYARLRDTDALTPAACERLLHRLQSDMFLGIFASDEALKFSLLLAREQTQPTPAFAALYRTGLGPLHGMLTHLVAVISGDPPDSPTAMLRAHTLFGQLQIFVMARALILRRLGWADYHGPRAGEILSVLSENLGFILAGLRRRRRAANTATS